MKNPFFDTITRGHIIWSDRTLRGGGWFNNTSILQRPTRYGNYSCDYYPHYGFRVFWSLK